MSRKRQRPKTQISTGNSNQFPVEDFDGMSLHDLEILAKAAPIALRNRIEKSLTSESFEEVVKAQSFWLSKGNTDVSFRSQTSSQYFGTPQKLGLLVRDTVILIMVLLSTLLTAWGIFL